MNAMRSWSFGDSLSAWLPTNRIVGLLKLKVRKILDTTTSIALPLQPSIFIFTPIMSIFRIYRNRWIIHVGSIQGTQHILKEELRVVSPE